VRAASAWAAAAWVLLAAAPAGAAPSAPFSANAALRLLGEVRPAEQRTPAVGADQTAFRLEASRQLEAPAGGRPLLKTSGAGGGGGSRIWVASAN